MVVLEAVPPLQASTAIGAVDVAGLCESDDGSSGGGKIVNKRFINLHNWIGPICPKSVKKSLVSVLKIVFERHQKY